MSNVVGFKKLSKNSNTIDQESDSDNDDNDRELDTNANSNNSNTRVSIKNSFFQSKNGQILLMVSFSLLLMILLILLTTYLVSNNNNEPIHSNDNNNNNNNNKNSFAWGTATASYQTEGAIYKDGRLASIWDTFCDNTNKVYQNESGKIADNSYNLYDIDIELLVSLGVTHYRLSLAWPRILPDGINVNMKGIEHYIKVIDLLNSYNITPMVTLFHWDLPQNVHDMTNGGWINSTIIDYFLIYANVVFKYFSDKVTLWTTFNEPWTVCIVGYLNGVHAPGRCSDRSFCDYGNSSIEPYQCAHNMLLSHAHVVRKLFHNSSLNYDQNGKSQIGMNLNIDGSIPASNNMDDIAASERRYIWEGGWFADPLYFGDYPAIMKEYIGNRLPTFTNDEKLMIKGSTDFFALNHYTSSWVIECNTNLSLINERNWNNDMQACPNAYNQYNNTLIGEKGASVWLYKVPYGIYHTIAWVANRYNLTVNNSSDSDDSIQGIYITENGVDAPNEDESTMIINDTFRVNFLNDYIDYVMKAKTDGYNVIGYFVWSLLDNFEWADGYSKRFGIHYVDYTTINRTRIPKQSAIWFKQYIKNHP